MYYLQSRYYDPNLGRFINADGLVSTGQGFLGNDMFTYCLNRPVVMADYGGIDAILLLDTDFPSHLGMLVEDENGVWWHFYWGAADFLSGSSSSIGFSAEVNTWCVPYDGELTVDAINDSGQWSSGTYEKKMYLGGDFSSCISEMDNISGGYYLLRRNCSQVSLSILSGADTDYTDYLNKAKTKRIPILAFNYMKKHAPAYTFFDRFAKRLNSLIDGYERALE